AAGVSTCPSRPCGPAGGFPIPGQLAPAEALHPGPHLGASPAPHGAPLAACLGPQGAESRHLQPARPGLIDSDPVDEEVLRALVLELGLDRADGLPELRLGHHEFDPLADLPAG
ncbi:CITE1 protein, partial [Neopipo cinnamomea]|nr:CITE1 protein [Neopipo cinnamomea]